MSIKPIDLQTLFVKMSEVSKEQSQVKEQAALQQAQAARSQVTREIEEDHKVTGKPEDSETQAVKDEDAEGSSGEERGEEERQNADQKDKPKKEVVTDPEVGRHIDLSG